MSSSGTAPRDSLIAPATKSTAATSLPALPSGTSLLRTEGYELFMRAAPIALANRRIVLVEGESGTGKRSA